MWIVSRRSSVRLFGSMVCVAMIGGAIAAGVHRRRAHEGAAPPAADRFALDEGGRLYARYCSPCHGESGRGDGRFYASSLSPAPPDFTDPAFLRSDQRLREAIASGSHGVGRSDLCPPWGHTLSSADLDDVASYIRHLQHVQSGASAAIN